MVKNQPTRTALIFIGNIEYCPYIREYQDILETQNIPYNVLFWERQQLTASYPKEYKYFQYPSKLTKKKCQKVKDFILFGRWIKSQLQHGGYSHCIFLDTLSGMLAYLFGIPNHLSTVLEIRDYSFENFPLFRYQEKKLIKKVTYCFISSQAFRAFLPESNYIVTHNINSKEYLNNISRFTFHKKIDIPLTLVYIGSIRYYDCQVSIIEEFKNQKQFRLLYHGIGPDYERLKQYCHEQQILNVCFTGKFTDNDKPALYKNADFLINCYDIRIGTEIKYAVSNKFYDGLIYHIPQLVEVGSYKGNIVVEHHIGISWDPNQGGLRERLLYFYEHIDEAFFNSQCLNLMKRYYQEYKHYVACIHDFLEQ